MEKNKLEELAEDQFYAMKEEWLDEDIHCVGGENKKDYEVDGMKFTIEVNGFWEKSDWFDWEVLGIDGITIRKGFKS